ncbi:MAG: Lrp/AsnC family transcriptional regulator [Sulfolobaceae archaeon]|nr:Lrp/AsnC family transcriptional regulator [Sulfolobales archaeon]
MEESSASEEVKLDLVDKKLLNELMRNARTSLRRLAEEMRVAPATLHNRIAKLERLGLIKGFTVLVDFQKLGYNLTAVIMIKVNGKYIVEVEKELAKFNNVMAVYDVVGEYDIIVIAKFRQIEELNDFLKELLKNPKIDRTHTNIVLNIVKEDPRLRVFEGIK